MYSVYVTIETDISLVSEIPVEELQTKGENVKIKENEKTATENNGNHEISLIWFYWRRQQNRHVGLFPLKSNSIKIFVYMKIEIAENLLG